MNSLPARIHDDATRAAAQITPADVPPLRLPAPRPGPARRNLRAAGPAQRNLRAAGPVPRGVGWLGRRHWLVPLAAAVCVVAVVAAVVAVGRADGGRRTGPAPAATGHPGPTHTAPASGHARAMLAAEALDYFFPATGAQYTDGLAYQWTQRRISAPIFGSCMARAGYPQPPFTEPEWLYTESFPDNSQFPDLAQRAASDTMIGPNYTIGGQIKLPTTRAGHKALLACYAADAKPFSEISRISGPLQNQWSDEIAAIQSSATVSATQPAFARCLEADGVPASLAERQDPGATNPLFMGFFAWADTNGQNATSTQQRAAQDRHETRVFVQCAGPVVHLVQTLQLSQRARFFQRHARQVQEIRTLAGALASAGR